MRLTILTTGTSTLASMPALHMGVLLWEALSQCTAGLAEAGGSSPNGVALLTGACYITSVRADFLTTAIAGKCVGAWCNSSPNHSRRSKFRSWRDRLDTSNWWPARGFNCSNAGIDHSGSPAAAAQHHANRNGAS